MRRDQCGEGGFVTSSSQLVPYVLRWNQMVLKYVLHTQTPYTQRSSDIVYPKSHILRGRKASWISLMGPETTRTRLGWGLLTVHVRSTVYNFT